MQEAVAEEFGERCEVLCWHAVEAAVFVKEAVGGEDMEVRVEDEVVAEGVDRSGSGDAPTG